MKEYLKQHGYTMFEKICPGVFVLAIRAFPQGYDDKFYVKDAAQYWKDSITAMLDEFGITSTRFKTKIGEAFDPRVQFYIDSVLAHQNKRKRRHRPHVDTSNSVSYQFNMSSPSGIAGTNPLRYDAPGRRWARGRGGGTQSRFEYLPDHPSPQPTPQPSLQEDVDALRRTVNQLALMGE